MTRLSVDNSEQSLLVDPLTVVEYANPTCCNFRAFRRVDGPPASLEWGCGTGNHGIVSSCLSATALAFSSLCTVIIGNCVGNKNRTVAILVPQIALAVAALASVGSCHFFERNLEPNHSRAKANYVKLMSMTAAVVATGLSIFNTVQAREC